MGFYGDVLIPIFDPFEASLSLTSEQLRAELEKLSHVAEQLRLSERWASVEISGPEGIPFRMVGPDGKRLRDHPPRIGVDFDTAPVVSIGFWRSYYTPTERDPSRTFGNPELKAELYRLADERRKDVEAVTAIANAASQFIKFPLRIELDIQDIWVYDFEVGYRRHLAYALGFEASIKEKSLRPYEDHVPVLVAGSVDELRKSTQNVPDAYQYSVYLNLTSLLDRSVAYENKNGQRHPHIQSDLVDVQRKRDFLKEQLLETAKVRSKSLINDAKLSLAANLARLEDECHKQCTGRGLLNDWGTHDPSEHYLSTS